MRWKVLKKSSYRVKFTDFYDLVEYAQEHRMCTKPGCTTCGCMPYRSLVREIGEKEFLALLARTDCRMDRFVYFDEWYEPLCVAAITLPGIKKSRSILMRRFLMEQEAARERSRKRRIEYEERMRKEQGEALKRKAEREERKIANWAKHQSMNEKRAKIMAAFSEMTLENKLNTIAMDSEHNPLFYGVDFSLISDDELRVVSKDILALLINNLDKHGDKRIRKFSERIQTILNSVIE